MRLGLVSILLIACHGTHPAPPAAPGVTGHVAIAPSAHVATTTGKLFVTWMTTDEARSLGGGDRSMRLIRDLVTRGVVVGDVDVARDIQFTVHPDRGQIVLAATVDVSHTGIAVIDGAGEGTLSGMSAAFEVGGTTTDAPPIALAARPRPPRRESCTGAQTTLERLEAPEVAGTVGNPTSRRVCVRVPIGYADHPERHYPVIYALPGLFSDDQAVFAKYDLDAKDVIVVGVDTSTKTGSTYLVDSATTGKWDTFFTRDLIPFVDARYRTLPHRQARALVGHSTGAFNAVSYGLRHPDLVGVIGASSPDGLDLAAWLSDGDRPRAWIQDLQRVERGLGGAGQLISYAADWSPTPDGYAWPYDASGAFVDRVLQRWLANSPSTLLRDPQRVAALKALSGHIYLTVGDVDEFDLYPPTVKFSQELTAAGIEHELVITHGGHLTHAREQMAAIARFCASKLEAAR